MKAIHGVLMLSALAGIGMFMPSCTYPDNYYDLCDSAFALYTLAKAGKPEPSYQTILYQRRDSLPEMSRLYLALAMSITGAPEKQVNDLLATPKKKLEETHYFLGSNTALGLRLLLDLQIGKNQAANATITELLNRRNANGHWGTTFSNAWILMALSAADRPAKDFTPLTLTVQGANAGTASLPAPISETTLTGVLAKGQNPAALKVNVPAGRSVYGHLQAKAWPDLKTFQPVIKGYSLQRKYERLTATGQREPAKDLRVGDLIVVTLTLDVRESNRYLALEDPLPSVFEPVNPEFATQNQRDNAAPDTWECDYREMRNDKVLFFTDDPPNQGKFELRYLARVIAEGDVIAPPARIEAMYEPDHYGLSGIDHVLTLPMSAGAKDVAKK